MHRADHGNVVHLKRKWILYFGGTPALFRRLAEASHRDPGLTGSISSTAGGMSFDWVARHDVAGAVSALQSQFVNLLVIDLRDTTRFDALVDEARSLLERLDHAEDLEQRYAFHRILILVPDEGVSLDRVDALLLEFGSLGVKHVLRESAPIKRSFEAVVHRTASRIMTDKKKGKTAICGAGGGTTGIYYELGVLKCLDDCLPGRGVNDFDLYFGISAGAVVTSLVSVGYTIDEIMASIAGAGGGRIPPMTLSLLRLGHFNYEDFRWRGRMAAQRAAKTLWRAVRTCGASAARTPFLEYPSLLGPPFRSDEFERMLRSILETPGATNDFRDLANRLYVGASDQDARQHVLFGSEGHDHISISRAVQASLSINPAFSSVPIEGRYYEDGAITRTSNFVEAIHRDATLIFVVDPFVPYVSSLPGFARRRGALYNVDQDIRTITFTRFQRTRDLVLRKHPEVSSYTLLPSNTTRRLLSVNPMDHRPFLEIWRGAYLSTLERIHRICHRLRGDLADHGMDFDTGLADAVARQLADADQVAFEDFFVERQIEIKTHPRCNERTSEARRLREESSPRLRPSVA